MKKLFFLIFLPTVVFSLQFEKPLGIVENLQENIQEISFYNEVPSRIKNEKGEPLQVGLPLEYKIDLHKIGDYFFLKDGKVVFRVSFFAPAFLWLSFEFENVKIPENAKFFIYRDENLIRQIKFENENIFIIPPFPSNRCIIEVDFKDKLEPFELKLSTVVLGFKDFLNAKNSQYCEVDINCPEGNDWQNEKRSVAGVYFGGYFCTGALLNNAKQDCKNYFLIANHCISNETNANRATFYWNYEWSGCASGDLLYGDYTAGATLKATNKKSDFTLLEITSQPKAEYKVYYSGWTIDPNPPTGAVIIHHPDADAKKISIEEHNLYLDGSFWKVPHYEVGATEPGSSGSPIYNMKHQVIGQLYGGYSTCDKPRNDFYGAFHISWSSGTSPQTRLKDWLDPDNTGILEIQGMDSRGCYRQHKRPFN